MSRGAVAGVVAAAAFLSAGAQPCQAQPVEKRTVVTISSSEIDGGIISEITWDGGVLILQGVVAEPDGQWSTRYLLVPADGIEVKKLKQPTKASQEYWDRKARRLSPTGLGRIVADSDASLPMYGVGKLERRIADSVSMGGMQQKHVLRLGERVIHERTNNVEPYEGEVWSWSPATLNRIAYVDGKGDLWVARADGRDARRLLNGDFTLPAWSDDGRTIAVAERKDGGKTWVISLVHLPAALLAP